MILLQQVQCQSVPFELCKSIQPLNSVSQDVFVNPNAGKTSGEEFLCLKIKNGRIICSHYSIPGSSS